MMKQETIKKAVKVINRGIKFYQRKLTYQLELRAEAEFDNGNLKIDSSSDYESNIKKYEIVLADLATIKRAIQNNQTTVKISGTAENRGYIYSETSKVLNEAGFDYDSCGFAGQIDIFPIEALEEEFEKEFSENEMESWSEHDIRDEGMAMQIYELINGAMSSKLLHTT